MTANETPKSKWTLKTEEDPGHSNWYIERFRKLAAETRRDVLRNLRQHLADDGRLVVGFGAGRDYDYDEFWSYVDEVGLRVELRLATWELRPFQPDSEFLVAVMARA